MPVPFETKCVGCGRDYSQGDLLPDDMRFLCDACRREPGRVLVPRAQSLIDVVLPDPKKPVNFDSLVDQYRAQIRELRGSEDPCDGARAEMLAQTDIETIRYLMQMNPGMTPEGALESLLVTKPSS